MIGTTKSICLTKLYEEYLEEASFLYTQRLSVLQNPETCWKKVGDFEERFEAHVDGLVVGGERAIEACKNHAQEGDFGELNAAVRVFCRLGRKDLVFSAIQQLDLEDPERVTALVDALKYEVPEVWYSDIVLLPKSRPELAPILWAVLGYRRAKVANGFSRILRSCPANYAAALIWTAGRIGNLSLEGELNPYFHSRDPSVQSAAVLALLRLGDQRALRYCERLPDGEIWRFIPLGLGGTRSTALTLLDSSNASNADDCLVALGLLGDISAIPTLLANLTNPEKAAAAANALQLISGANFSEKVFIPDEIEEDSEFGTTVVRLSQKPDDWVGWWREHESAFDSRVRYRYGKPYSPLVLLEGLQCEKTPHRFRQLAYEELVIRYGLSIPFEADMFVSDQVKALQQIDLWIQANNGKFREGAWYFQGNLMYG
jgi:uncharacterized protein (TIGR02270 family)